MRFLVAVFLLALAGHAQAQDQTPSRFRPYVTADVGLGKLLDVETDEDDPEAVQDMSEDLSRPLVLSVSGGFLQQEKHLGVGVFYLLQDSKAEMDGTVPFLSGVTLSSAEQEVSIRIFGAQLVALPPLGPNVRLRGEFGMGHAKIEQKFHLALSGYEEGQLLVLRNKTTVDYSGLAFQVGAGLDIMITPGFGIGAKAVLIRGEASLDDAESTTTVDGYSETNRPDSDNFDDVDFSSINGSLGVRILF